MIPVLAKIIRHHHIVAPAPGIDRAGNFGFRPRIAVLVYFNICPSEDGRVEQELQRFRVALELQRFLLRNEGTITVKRRLMVRLHVFYERFKVPGSWYLSTDGLTPKYDSRQRNDGCKHCLKVVFPNF